MPRHNHQPARKSRSPQWEPRPKPTTYEGLARALVLRGLADSTILTPGEPLTGRPPASA